MFKPKYREKVYISARVSTCVQYALRFNLYSYQLYIAPKKLKIIIPPPPTSSPQNVQNSIKL